MQQADLRDIRSIVGRHVRVSREGVPAAGLAPVAGLDFDGARFQTSSLRFATSKVSKGRTFSRFEGETCLATPFQRRATVRDRPQSHSGFNARRLAGSG